jgi:hypothetical protein
MSNDTYNLPKAELAKWLLYNTSLDIGRDQSLLDIRGDWEEYSRKIKNDSCSNYLDTEFKKTRGWKEWMEPEKSKYLVITDEN